MKNKCGMSGTGLFALTSFLPLLLILTILIRPGILWAGGETEDPGLTAYLDRDSAEVGSIVALILNYRIPKGAQLPPDPLVEGLEDLTIVERVAEPGHIKIKLFVDRLGSWKTGVISLAYLDEEGKTQVLTVDPLSLTVLSNLGEKPDEAQLRPIQGIIPIKAPWLIYLPWAAGTAGLLLIVLGLVWWLKRRRRNKLLIPCDDPPHIRARNEIERLEAQGLFEKGHVKEFYFRFSEVLRRYLEAIRGFPAAESTTEEIAFLIDREMDRSLLPLLRQADLIKFADTIPPSARKEEEVRDALSYIRKTSPAPDTEGSAAGPTGVAG
ncbi:MAG: hypothetical protein SV775_00485 [Thermodesulfobacteriota bacterium]|nr:hypothetical protein [Thermodesulfobacteriota bacterium]